MVGESVWKHKKSEADEGAIAREQNRETKQRPWRAREWGNIGN